MYKIDDLYKFETAEDAAQHIIDEMPGELYDESLDYCFDMVNVCGFKYYPSEALKRLDPIAYRCGYSDYTDSCYSDVLYELERMSDGDEIDVYDCAVAFFDIDSRREQLEELYEEYNDLLEAVTLDDTLKEDFDNIQYEIYDLEKEIDELVA